MPRGGARPNTGGARPGAGRPKKEPMKSVTIRISERLYNLLQSEAETQQKTVSTVAAEKLTTLLQVE